MKRVFTLWIATALATAVTGQQPVSGPQLVTGNTDLIGLNGYPYSPLLIEAGPDNFYWMGAAYRRIVNHPLLSDVVSDFSNIYFIKYDDDGEALCANYIRGAYDIIDAFSYKGGITIVASTYEDVVADGNMIPINSASDQEFLASYDAKCNFQKIVPVWDLDQYQYPNSVPVMDKRDGTIYLAGAASVPFRLAGYGLIGEEWSDYLYVLKFDRDLGLAGVYVTGFDTGAGQYGSFRNLSVTPDVYGNVVVQGGYQSDQSPVFGEERLPPVADGYGLFALKLDNNLQMVWVRGGTMGGIGYYDGTMVMKGFAMKNGDLVMTGITNTGYFQLGEAEVIFEKAIDYTNLFAYRMTPDGSVLWTTKFRNMHQYYGEGKGKGVESDQFSTSIEWDAIQWNDKVLYLTGIFESDSMEVAGEVLDKKYGYGVFVAAVDLGSGEQQWGYGLSSDNNTSLFGFDQDAGGNVSVMGYTGPYQDFDGIGPDSVPGTNLIFHLGLDYNGNPLWHNNAYLVGLGYGHYGADLEVLHDGEVFSSMTNSSADDALSIGGSVLSAPYTYSTWLVALDADNELGGTVTDMSGLPVYPGYVKAYKFARSGAYPAVDSTGLDEEGGYLLKSLYPGSYTLLALPDRLEYPDGMPTYLGNVVGWNSAQFLPIETDTRATFLNITLTEVPKLTPADGSGGIAGNVSYEEEGGLKGTMARPVTRTSVILKKRSERKSTMDDEIIAYVITDDLGNFFFVNVPDGQYTLIVDIPGLEMLEEHHVTIQGNQIVSGLDYTVSDEGIYTYTGVGIPPVEEPPFRLYPNPGNGLIRIESAAEVTCHVQVFNSTGQLVAARECSTASGSGTLDLSEVKDGLYMIQFRWEHGTGTLKYLKR
jgi:hypothetical protein